jgi:transposase
MASPLVNDYDPYAYLKDVLERLPTYPASSVEELLSHRWQRPLAHYRSRGK